MNSLSEDNQIQVLCWAYCYDFRIMFQSIYVTQLQKYLRFFRQKRDGLQRILQDEFREAKADKCVMIILFIYFSPDCVHIRADEDVFTKDDVMDFIESLSGKVRVRRTFAE